MSALPVLPASAAGATTQNALVAPATRTPTSLAVRAHHRLLRLGEDERGQGTVEYVALAMLIAAVMAGVVVAAGGLKGGGIAQAVVEKVKAAIGAAGTAPKP